MKNLILLFVLICSVNANANVVVGLVDVQTILTSIKEGKSIMKKLEKSFNTKKDKLKKEEEAIMKLQTEYKNKAALMNDKARADKEKQIQERIMKIQQMQNDFQKEMNDEETALKKPVLDRLKVIIEDVSKEAKVTMTFEVSSSPVVYAENKVDLTDKVVKAYDKKHSK